MYRIVLSFLVAFILLLVVIALNRLTYNKETEFNKWTEHSRAVITLYNNLAIQLRSSEIYAAYYKTSSAGGLYNIYKTDIDSLENTLSVLRAEVNDNPEQVKLVDSIQSLVLLHLPVLRKKSIQEMVEIGDTWAFNDLKRSHDMISMGLEKEKILLTVRKEELNSYAKINNSLTLILAIFAIILITATFFSQFFLSKNRKWLEGFLESILNTSQNGIMHCKAVRQRGQLIDFTVAFANKASQELLGGSPEDMIGKKWSEIPALKKSELLSVCTQVNSNGNPVSLEYLDYGEQTERWFVLSIAKMEDGVTIAFYESTALKATEQELKKNITALQQSNQELEEYAYAASHDLQEPLRKIRTFGGFLQDTQHDKLDEKGKEQLDKIMHSAERMRVLIKDLLSYSSLQQKEEFVVTDLNEIVDNVLEDFEVLIAQTGAVITYNKLPDIAAIPVQMNQLFYNLISNSLKFSKKDMPLHLNISCREVTTETVKDVSGLLPEQLYYEITVSDNGIGFSQDYASQIFGLFKKLNDSTSYVGSGIGLALCKKVVINHGGIIMANGKPGVGAQFYIYLPKSFNRSNAA